MKWVVLLAVAAGLAAEREALPARLSLAQAQEIAFRNSTVLRRAAAQMRQADGQAGQARSQLLPQLGVTASELVQTVNLKAMGIDVPFLTPRVGPFQVVDARAAVTQNVLNVPALNRDRAMREQQSAVGWAAANAREALAAQVALGFAHALRAQDGARTFKRQLELARRLHAITEARAAEGVASKLDLVRSAQQVNALEQALVEAENALTAAKLDLANLLNAKASAAYELEETQREPQAGADPEAEAVAQALESRADYRAAQARVRAAELQLKAVRNQRLPMVQFRADYGQIGRKPFENLNTFRLQGILTVPVYTGGRIEAEVVEARGRLEEARALAEEVRSQVETEVLRALAAVDAARKQLEVAARNVALAGDELGLATARFTEGIADNTEVVNAQDRVTRAEDARLRAAMAADVARAQLHRALGTAEKAYRAGGSQR